MLSSQDQPLQPQEQQEIVHWLLNNGADINAQTDYGSTPLTLAVELGDVQLVEDLCRLGADINLMSHDGDENNPLQSNALLQAITHENVELIRMLIEQGATPFVENSGWEDFGILDVLYRLNPELADLLKAKFLSNVKGGCICHLKSLMKKIMKWKAQMRNLMKAQWMRVISRLGIRDNP